MAKSKKKLLVGVLFTIVIIIGLVALGLKFAPTAQTVAGFSTLGLSQVDLRSENPFFDGQTWVLSIVQGKLAQQAEGTFTPQDIEEKTGDETTEKDFSITVNYEDQQCVYPVQEAGLDDPIFKIDKIEWFCLLSPDEGKALEKLEENGIPASSALGYFGKFTPSTTCFAYYWNERSPVAFFGNTDIRSRMTVDIEAGDRSGSRTLDTETSIQGEISDFAYVVWQGNLDTGKSCEFTTDPPFRPAYVNGMWRIIAKGAYDTYKNKFDNKPASTSRDDIEGWESELNSARQNAIISQNFGESTSAGFDDATNFDAAVLREDIQDVLQSPLLTLYVKSATLGIFTPTPELEIISAQSDCFRTGDEGIITITAKNKGGDDGTWNFFGICDDDLFDITRNKEAGILAGETKIITLPISGSAAQREEAECSIFAESPAGTIGKSVDVCVDPQITCNVGTKFCGTSGGFDVVKKCDSGGATSSVIEICAVSETCVNAKCIADTGGKLPGIGFFSDLWNNITKFFDDFRLITSIVVGILAALAGGLLWKRIQDSQNMKTHKSVPFIAGAVIGGFIGYVTFLLFWVGIIAILLFFIIRFFIPIKIRRT